LSSFETKTKRKKLQNSYSDLSEVVGMFVIDGEADFMLQSAAGKAIMFNTALVLAKSARDTQGVQVMRLTKTELASVKLVSELTDDLERFRIKTIPQAGILTDDIDQIKL
ncbi:MAG: topoisomerase IV, partial [Oscillospiraceae bacterium]